MSQRDMVANTQSTVARVTGAALVLGLVILLPVNYFTSLQYGVSDIMANVVRYRFNIAVNVFYVLDLLVVLGLLYQILRQVDQRIAMIATVAMLVFAVGWGMMTVKMLNILQLMGGATNFGSSTDFSAFSIDQLHALAKLQAAYSSNVYYIVGLPAWALASTLYGILWLKSKYIPKMLAIFGILASVWGMLCAFANIAVPHFDQIINVWAFDLPIVIFEFLLGAWLLFKGLNTRGNKVQEIAVTDDHPAARAVGG